MHFHNSSTRNYVHPILLIMTGNAHKESCHKLLLILVRRKELYMIKTNYSGEMMVPFTIKKLFNGKPILRSCVAACRFPIYISGIKFLIWLCYWSCFRHSHKSGCCFHYIRFYKLLWFCVDFFLNLGLYYNAVEQNYSTNFNKGPVG